MNDEVLQVWDSSPSEEQKQAEGGWQEAVEIFPDLTQNREIITTHTIDIDKTPVEIVWGKRSVTVEERKSRLVTIELGKFRRVVDEQMFLELDSSESSGDMNVIAEAKTTKDQNIAEINALTTHEEIDARMGIV